MSIRADVVTLKQQFEQLFPGKWGVYHDDQKTIFTGLAEIDGSLARGLFRQRICQWTGPQSSGKTSLLRQAIANWTQAGLNVTYIDYENKLMACDWAFIDESKPGKFWVVRPCRPTNKKTATNKDLVREALWACEQLIACRTFDVVILDLGTTPFVGSRTYTRLQKSLQKSKTALLLVRDIDFSPANDEALTSASYGIFRQFNFHWGESITLAEGLSGTAMLLPEVSMRASRDGMSQNNSVTLSTNGDLYVPNCLFTHPQVPDRRVPKT